MCDVSTFLCNMCLSLSHCSSAHLRQKFSHQEDLFIILDAQWALLTKNYKFWFPAPSIAINAVFFSFFEILFYGITIFNFCGIVHMKVKSIAYQQNISSPYDEKFCVKCSHRALCLRRSTDNRMCYVGLEMSRVFHQILIWL